MRRLDLGGGLKFVYEIGKNGFLSQILTKVFKKSPNKGKDEFTSNGVPMLLEGPTDV